MSLSQSADAQAMGISPFPVCFQSESLYIFHESLGRLHSIVERKAGIGDRLSCVTLDKKMLYRQKYIQRVAVKVK